MVELFEQNVRTIDRQSSKGNQLKWENGGFWYKADYTGYEGLAEYLVSQLLAFSTLDSEMRVMYDLETISYRGQKMNGVRSRNFLKDRWQIITLERLFYQFFGSSLHDAVWRINDHRQRLIFLVEQVERITGLREFGKYMNRILTIDAFFLNEDRHTHNLAVLMDEAGNFKYCPVFDHGAALLADTTLDYPLSGDVYEMMGQVRSKTFCPDFEEQLEISEQLYGNNLRFFFTTKNVDDLLNKISEMEGDYSQEVIRRVQTILHERIRIFSYLFDRH